MSHSLTNQALTDGYVSGFQPFASTNFAVTSGLLDIALPLWFGDRFLKLGLLGQMVTMCDFTSHYPTPLRRQQTAIPPPTTQDSARPK